MGTAPFPSPSSPTLATVKVQASVAAEPPSQDLWQELRESFVMDDCGGSDPQAIAHWSQLFTESPRHFQANLQRAMPSLRYIQQIAKQRGIPGEFVLLPWIESHYLPVFSRRDRPVGMWQIMPATAKSMGLQVSHGYDARLDTAATTQAIFDLIAGYYAQYHDWRLADYAFNGGTGTIDRLLDRYGPPAAQPAIPTLPVRRKVREHLLKLMAIACVIRHPDDYGVELPRLAPADRLEPVVIPKAMPVAEAAARAGLDTSTLTELNSAFLDGTIDPSHSETLLLPRANVQQWYQPQDAATVESAPSSAAIAPFPTTGTPSRPRHPASHPHPARRMPERYTVRHGDTIRTIAQSHHLSPAQLRRWNHLQGKPLRPGQILRLRPAAD